MTNRNHQDTKAQRKDQDITLYPGVLLVLLGALTALPHRLCRS